MVICTLAETQLVNFGKNAKMHCFTSEIHLDFYASVRSVNNFPENFLQDVDIILLVPAQTICAIQLLPPVENVFVFKSGLVHLAH